jgi:hypothetical protein
MKINRTTLYIIIENTIVLLGTIVGIAMMAEATYPVSSFVIDPTPEQARVISFLFGLLFLIFIWNNYENRLKEFVGRLRRGKPRGS